MTLLVNHTSTYKGNLTLTLSRKPLSPNRVPEL